MFCKKKQIQSRKLINEARNYSKNFAGDHVIKIKNGQKKQLGLYCDEKSYQIDPWHIKSNSKFEQIATKNLNDFSLSKQVKRRTTKRNSRDIAIVNKNDNKPYANSQIQAKFDKADLIQQSISPTKIDMLECSFRFEQYEHQKAEQLKSSFLNKLFQQNQNRKNPSTQRNKNFIQKNIKGAFQLQGLPLQSYIHTQRKRTIQQSKQQLLLNKEKLKQQSKELHTFISMKESDQNRKSNDKNKEKVCPQTASFWHMSYVDKSHNPETFSRNFIQHLTFDKMLKRKNKIQRSKTVQMKKSQDKKRSSSFFIQNTLPQENQQFLKDIDQSKTKQFKTETKKFNRILKLRNKSTLIVTNKQNEDDSQVKHDRKKHHQNRIHSSPGKGSKDDSKQSSIAVYSNDYLSKFQNIQISKFADLQGRKYIKKFAKPRSISACMTRSQINNLSDRSIFKKYYNQRSKATEELFVQGSMCEMKNIYPL